MRFEQVLAAQTDSRATIPEGWKQGRATYGGLTAAILYRALAFHVPAERPLRWVSFSLVGPSDPGEVELEPRVLRQGKNVIQGQCEMRQQGGVVATMQAAFGAGRDSRIIVPPAPAPDFPAPDDCTEFPRIEGLTPEFLQHFRMRVARGGLPFSGTEGGELGGWMRFEDETGPLDTAGLIGMLDCWPPAVLPMFRKPAPVSTLTWTIQFLHAASEQRGDQWWQYLAQTEASGDGYAQTRARFLDGKGTLMGISSQTVTVFA